MNMLELTRRCGEKIYVRIDYISEIWRFGDRTIVNLINGRDAEVVESVESIMNVLEDIGTEVYTVQGV